MLKCNVLSRSERLFIRLAAPFAMTPDVQEVRKYTQDSSQEYHSPSVEGRQYQMNTLGRSLEKMRGFGWSQKAIILSGLVSLLVTAVVFGFLTSAVFVPKYFQLGSQLQELANIRQELASLRADEDDFRKQSLANSLSLNEQLRQQGLKIQTIGSETEAVRRTVEGNLAADLRVLEQEKARQLAQAQEEAKASEESKETAFVGWPVGENTNQTVPPSSSGSDSQTPSLISSDGGSSSLGDLLKSIYDSFIDLFAKTPHSVDEP